MRRNSKLMTLGLCLIMAWSLGMVACGGDDDSSGSGATSNGTSSTSNGTSSTSNGTSSTSNGTSSTSNGTSSTSNGTSSTSNGTSSTSNGTSSNTSNGTSDEMIDCGGTMCGSDAVVVGGAPLIAFPPCCINTSDCGLDVTEASDTLGVTGCYELARAGDPDESCASVTIEVIGSMVELPGCCQEANGMCGVALDVTALGAALGATGPDFGCQDPAPVDENYVPMACGN